MTEKMLMKKLMALDFMAVDLALFLDTHPHDVEALKTFECISDECKKTREKYEEEFGPLCTKNGVCGGSWKWIDNPWPWQKEAGFSLKGDINS